jgi:hypothetical protein
MRLFDRLRLFGWLALGAAGTAYAHPGADISVVATRGTPRLK